jgi:RNA polymerase sigma-70 factor (ECF subfamily)
VLYRNYPIERTPDFPVQADPSAASLPSDLELIQSAARDDDEAFHRLIDRHARRLFRIALSLSSSRADAEDVLQETLIGAFQSIKRFDGRSSVKTWLTSILMKQAAKGWHRGRHSRNNVSIHCGDKERDGEDSSMMFESRNEDVDRQLDLATVLQYLSPPHRQIIVLREIEQMSYDEIAEALRLPRGTVESRLHRARLELRERLHAYAT